MTTSTYKKVVSKVFTAMWLLGLALCLLAWFKGSVFGATTTPYRTSPYSSGASVQLRGVSNGDTLTGTYNSEYGMFEFSVESSGFYTKWYDLLGGTSYERDESWSDTTGKWITGGNMAKALQGYNDIRFLSAFDDINTFVRSAGDTTILMFDTTPDTLTDTNLVFQSGKIVDFGYHLFVHKNKDRADDEFDAQMNLVLQDSNIVFKNGRFDGLADVLPTQVSIQNVTTSQMDINLSGIPTDSLKYWYVYVTAGASADSCVQISGNSASVGSWTTITFGATWTYPPDHTSTVYITPHNEFNFAFWAIQSKNIRFENLDIFNWSGDGINLNDCQDVTITGCNIDVPLIFFQTKPQQLLLGRQGISIIAQPVATPYSADWTVHGKTKPNPVALIKNIRIINNKIRGGAPGCIDIEPNGTATVESVDISHNYLWEGNRGLAIENLLATFKNILVSYNTFEDNTWGGSLKALSATNINYSYNSFINQDVRMLWLANGIESVSIKGNYLTHDGSDPSDNTYALELPVGGKLVNIEGNTFDGWPGALLYAINGNVLTIRNNKIFNLGRGASSSKQGFTISGWDKVIIENNIFQDQGDGFYSKPGTISNCDTVVLRNNISSGGLTSDYFTVTGYSVLVDEDNGFPSINQLFERDYVNLLQGNSLVDSLMLSVDSLSFYIVEFDTSQNRTYTIKWSDSTKYVHGPDSTWTQLIIQPENDSLWIVGSSTFTDDSISVYDYTYGQDIMVGDVGDLGQKTVGKTLYPASKNRLLFPGYRDVIPRALGASIEAWNFATYLTSNPTVSQKTALNFYTNWYESGLLSKPKAFTKSLALEGEHVVPTGLQLPSDSTSVPRFGDIYISTADSLLYFYNGLTFVKIDTLN